MKKNAVYRFFQAFFVIILIMQLPGTRAFSEERIHSLHVNVSVSVDNPAARGEELIDFCESSGGYYLRKSDSFVSFRIPKNYYREIEEMIKQAGVLTHYNAVTADLENEYLLLEKQLAARENMYKKLFNMLGNADVRETISLEKEILNLLSEIERIKGRIKMIQTEAYTVKVDVYFYSESFTEPGRILSSFEWINNIDFYSFIKP